jgi:uncharacterized membrane protein YbhN (UPF0104 family)
MSEKAKKWMFASVRLIVCSVALAWVLHNVTYYDYVTLKDGTRIRAAHVVVGPENVQIAEVAGPRREIPAEQIARTKEGDLKIKFGLRTTVLQADQSTLLWCFVIFAPVTLIQSQRFQWMLRAQEIRISYWESLKLCYAGNFLNFITALGSTGGDVFKMYYVTLHTKRRMEAVTTVFLDRVVGLYGLILLVGVLAVARIGDAKMAALGYGFAVMLAGSLIAYALLFSQRVRSVINVGVLLGKLPFGTYWQRAEAATRRLAHHKSLVFGALGATVLLQLIALTAMVLAAKALHMRWDPAAVWDYYTYLGTGVVIAAIPISPQGLGTMEAFYKYAFLGTHGSLAALLCLAMAVRAINLFWALPGVIVTMTGAYRPRISSKDIQLTETSHPDPGAAS